MIMTIKDSMTANFFKRSHGSKSYATTLRTEIYSSGGEAGGNEPQIVAPLPPLPVTSKSKAKKVV